MPRYRLTLEYDGGPYKGFQAQDDLPTVQGAVERAVLAFTGESVRLQAAGRTDTGVHATGQVVHVDLTREWPALTVRNALNAHLVDEAVVVLDAEVAPEDWHARFSATERRYLYRILNRPAPPALDRGRVWHVKSPLDAGAMHAAAQVLVGHHDFTTFRDLACQAKSPVKTLDVAEVSRRGEEVWLSFASRSFLHRQVRSMTGTLAEVGIGRWTAADVKAALEARDRRACGPVAPATGLVLTGVAYADGGAAK
ncbi:tRNA pseudouridine(38-40) synthase TruA [Phenylobacterium sp.]|jgi:tRNA pseudouridine38-40 synthase|uniref:tRNA pseudouridine(38-40) synthase TruA n=1 Tax=Phenylobacterium sp. TaxID=1871053 RepID=UPI0025D1E171|nr:tRNA pseudouridine(38-40) synthase TruA [Phenylobacterium sp.]MCA3719474.1 tRNA pseudouridine(38-40) synthase TruA [Phenylobacterium sp.]